MRGPSRKETSPSLPFSLAVYLPVLLPFGAPYTWAFAREQQENITAGKWVDSFFLSSCPAGTKVPPKQDYCLYRRTIFWPSPEVPDAPRGRPSRGAPAFPPAP